MSCFIFFVPSFFLSWWCSPNLFSHLPIPGTLSLGLLGYRLFFSFVCISAWATPASQLRSVQTSSNTVIFYCSLYTRDKRIFNLKCSLSTYVLQTLKLLVWYLKYMSIWSLHQVLHFLSIAHIGLLTLISYWNQWIGRISGNPLNHL